MPYDFDITKFNESASGVMNDKQVEAFLEAAAKICPRLG